MSAIKLLDLPCDIIDIIIKKYLNYRKCLINFKTTCKYIDQSISQFYLKKMLLKYKLSFYIPTEMCVNIDCYDETWDIYEDIYHHGSRRYIHSHQLALNNCVININLKKYNISTPYCCECYKKYVLIGDRKYK